MKKTQSGGRWKHLCEVTPEFTLLFFFQMIETILDYMALRSCFKYRQTLSLEKKKDTCSNYPTYCLFWEYILNGDLGFPGGTCGKELTCQCKTQEMWV